MYWLVKLETNQIDILSIQRNNGLDFDFSFFLSSFLPLFNTIALKTRSIYLRIHQNAKMYLTKASKTFISSFFFLLLHSYETLCCYLYMLKKRAEENDKFHQCAVMNDGDIIKKNVKVNLHCFCLSFYFTQ